ncbi:MAG: DUF86 domain-containing protein [Candidatus Heimdallarchaeota archaeon]|nr:DUF86 domain-containing protein [Candidatus Heimdallarchaeota archaeon]MCK5047800.1 DUF86 domain-containing protein [Candidatus Heimdallarchaeota archaeon]
MDQSRKKRYLDKLQIIRERSKFCEKKVKELSDTDAKAVEEDSIFSLWYAFQTMVQSILDIIAMICMDEKISPRSDKINVDAIVKDGLLTTDFAKVINEARGLRNILVHEYNGIISDQAIDSIGKLLPHLKQVSKVFREWLTQN